MILATGRSFCLAVMLSVCLATRVVADQVEARCDIYPAGSDTVEKMVACNFAQRQGFVTITLDNGLTHELSPTGEKAGDFLDEQGRRVYRQSGLGDQGLIFRFPAKSVYVYWSTAGLEADDSVNPTWPFSTTDYDATTLLRCRTVSESSFASCPAGILRMDNGQASIVVMSQAGEQFTINFLSEFVNATNRKVAWTRGGDIWTVTIDDEEIYEVPQAADNVISRSIRYRRACPLTSR